MHGMRHGIAIDHDPGPAGIVIPQITGPAGGVVSVVDIVVPGSESRIARWPIKRDGIALTGEFAPVALSAAGAGDPHGAMFRVMVSCYFVLKILAPQASRSIR
jgi:hypothetical protein